MLKRFNVTVAAALLVAGGPAWAQSRAYVVTVAPAPQVRGFDKLHISKAALGGAEISLWSNTAIDPDCTEHAPGATLRIVEAPAHGTARISDDPLYLAFPPGNPRSACNDRKIPGHEAFYSAAAGYTGHDKVVLEGSSPGGRVRRITVDILVR
ncbi:MAG TPA: hypothetical protein VJS38_17570 [Phenylobacterium sp.]|uniref:hypothetical protein n=1 Tax=Phenylobacterium sp. TaxID=1871053 RepID=UPI002B47116D|nr:hypothetical protein [Phenylobacterium sp.]HKR89980.1 hypothetical protein [Phenylobacterium sp.]